MATAGRVIGFIAAILIVLVVTEAVWGSDAATGVLLLCFIMPYTGKWLKFIDNTQSNAQPADTQFVQEQA